MIYFIKISRIKKNIKSFFQYGGLQNNTFLYDTISEVAYDFRNVSIGMVANIQWLSLSGILWYRDDALKTISLRKPHRKNQKCLKQRRTSACSIPYFSERPTVQRIFVANSKRNFKDIIFKNLFKKWYFILILTKQTIFLQFLLFVIYGYSKLVSRLRRTLNIYIYKLKLVI